MKTPPSSLNGHHLHHRRVTPLPTRPREPARRWQDVACLLLGAWLFAMPWIWPDAVINAAAPSENAWAAWLPGSAIVLLSLLSLARPKFIWTEWCAAAVGFWLVIQPSIPGFARIASLPTWNAWAVGLVVCVLAVWAA